MTDKTIKYLGIDISKKWIDVCYGDKGKVKRIAMKKSSINSFIKKHFEENEAVLAVLESTGGYEVLPAKCLESFGIKVHIAHPNKVVSFAKAMRCLAKTDAIDAKVLKAYGAFIKDDDIRGLPSDQDLELNALSSRLGQLKETHHQEACRLGLVKDKILKSSSERMLKYLKKEIEKIEQHMMAIINEDKVLANKFDILTSMPGIGANTACCIVCDLPEIGRINNKEIAALVGVAPITNQSGMKSGYSAIKYGRSKVRKTLYMAALVATRFNSRMKDFYNRLLENGKIKKVAIVAVMRKMLVTLNAMVKKNMQFSA